MRPPEPPDPLAHVPFPTSDIVKRVVVASGFTLPADALSAVIELDRKWIEANTAARRYSPSQAIEDHRSHEKRFAASPHTMEAQDSFTKDEWLQDYAVKRHGWRAEQVRLYEQTVPLVKPHIESLVAAVRQLADKLEANDRLAFESLGLAYAPSVPVLISRKTAQMIERSFKEATVTAIPGRRPVVALLQFVPGAPA